MIAMYEPEGSVRGFRENPSVIPDVEVSVWIWKWRWKQNNPEDWSVELNCIGVLRFSLPAQPTLLAFTANSAAQSSAIVVIDTSNNAWHSQVHWLFGTAYLAVKASNASL